jgi:hypothetical protein
MFLLLIGLLAAVGCAARASAPGPARMPLVLGVDPASPLWDATVAAVAAWRKATGLDIRVAADGTVPVLFVASLNGCGATDEGCSFGGDESRIEVREDTPSDHLAPLIMHELGHLLRGDGLHLASPDDLMSSPTRAKRITADDLAFICEQQRCSV